ncbi:MAG: Ppx/GppA phosphatase family protein [Helicobacteraceae bacterium]
MAKITAVIDIGSNSARMAIFKKTSRFGFYLLDDCKARVRLSENSFQNGGALQKGAMERTCLALEDFLKIAKFYKARKILCVATAAVRSAPNRQEFLSCLRQRHKLNAKVIDGQKEAFFGGLGALNLLDVTDGVTVDIGGGSCEFALLRGGKIEKTVSLELGTVRLKESFFDGAQDLRAARIYIASELEKIAQDFANAVIIGIGGTIRSISEAIIKKEKWPINTLHGFTYELKGQIKFLEEILSMTPKELKKAGFKDERLDVIREGALIFLEIVKRFGAKTLITSGVGVREGVFLADLLRSCGQKFPPNFNPSIRAIMDRFELDKREVGYLIKISLRLFALLSARFGLDERYKKHLLAAVKILNAGKTLNFYKRTTESFELAIYGLSYGFSHSDKILIACILESQQKKPLQNFEPNPLYKQMLPDAQTLFLLSFTVFVASVLNKNKACADYDFAFENDTLIIKSQAGNYLSREYFKSLTALGDIQIRFE